MRGTISTKTTERATWGRDDIVRAILRRENGQQPINAQAVRGSEPPLYAAAVRHFGSWRNALKFAGVDPERVGKQRHWDGQQVLCRVRELSRNRCSLSQATIVRRDSGLHRAAIIHFGTWANTLIAAGISPESVCRKPMWDRESIIEAILLRAVRNESLGSTTVRPRSLKSAAVEEFGSWAAGLEAAGLEPGQYIGRTGPRSGRR